MKYLSILSALLLVLISLPSCTATTPSPIVPGDKIGDFTITTGVAGKFTYGFAVQCTEPQQGNAYTCNATLGQVINISTGLRGRSGSSNLDAVWKNSNYRMFIDGQPVDLAAFGTIEYNHPTSGMIRFANVVITTDKPGTITVRDSGVFDNGEQFSSTSTYIFTQP